jgi:hypothetical protein
MSLWSRVKAAAKALLRPEHYAPPPLPTIPPEPAPPRPRPRPRDRDISRPPAPRRTRFIPRSELPDEWGRNQAALWSEATRAHNEVGRDPDAQALYDAALYMFDEDPENRAAILGNFKKYIMDTYGIDWDSVFDWEDYRANYDEVAVGVGCPHGGNARS